MRNVSYIDLETYKFYITESGNAEVLYESTDIDFLYTSQYIIVIRENTGPSNSTFTLDKLSKTTSAIEYPDKDSRAELRIYNGLAQHQLLPEFQNKIDIYLTGVNGNEKISSVAKGQFSNTIGLSFGDYSLNITPNDDEIPFTKNHFVSLDANSDKTVFLYLSEEEEEDDGDSDTEEDISLYVNSLPVENSHRISLYDHQINVINFVDDFSLLDIYFVRSNETVSDADYHLKSTRATPQTITLPNNSYDVSILVKENESELLLAFDQLSLSSDSGDLFMVIEEDEQSSSGYKIQFILQNED